MWRRSYSFDLIVTLVSILRGQVFRWNFVEIVAPVVGGVCAESAPAPEVYG
jgi:hypothetical protein